MALERISARSAPDGSKLTPTDVESTCMAIPSNKLVAKVSQLQRDGQPCAMDLNGVVATRSVEKGQPSHCKDDDAAMKAFAGMSCRNVKANHQCSLIKRNIFPNICHCSCPSTDPKQRSDIMVGARLRRLDEGPSLDLIAGSQCSLNSFQGKLEATQEKCCNPQDRDDKCHGTVPVNCDYECAAELPSFFPACKHLISVLSSQQAVAGFKILHHTCATLPVGSLIATISSVTTCNHSTCNDGKENGDEGGLDCGGSCTHACRHNTSLLPAPREPACGLDSVEVRLSVVDQACTTESDYGLHGNTASSYYSYANTSNASIDNSTEADGSGGTITTPRSLFSSCGLQCAVQYVQFYDDCKEVLDVAYNTSMLSKFQTECLHTNVSAVVDEIERDRRVFHCKIDVEGVVARVQHSATISSIKTTCRDDDVSMRAAMGITCAEVRGKGACFMFQTKVLPKNYSECSCPTGKAAITSRKLQSGVHEMHYEASATCTLQSFDSELAAMNAACCNQNDRDDQCDNSVPKTCDYECASIFPPTFDRCEPLMRKLLGVVKMPDFVRLYCVRRATDGPTTPRARHRYGLRHLLGQEKERGRDACGLRWQLRGRAMHHLLGQGQKRGRDSC